jgi:hypothetical protein
MIDSGAALALINGAVIAGIVLVLAVVAKRSTGRWPQPVAWLLALYAFVGVVGGTLVVRSLGNRFPLAAFASVVFAGAVLSIILGVWLRRSGMERIGNLQIASGIVGAALSGLVFYLSHR